MENINEILSFPDTKHKDIHHYYNAYNSNGDCSLVFGKNYLKIDSSHCLIDGKSFHHAKIDNDLEWLCENIEGNYCNTCGAYWEEENADSCPVCGSSDIN